MTRWGTWILLLAAAMLLGTTGGIAQPVLNATDIPVTPGTTAEFYIEGSATGVPVNVGPSGANRFYDFTHGDTGETTMEEIIAPDDSPYFDTFPDANRVSYGPAPFGISGGSSWRYDLVGQNNWFTLGLAVTIEDLEVPFPLPVPLQIAPLPLNYGDEWDQTISETTVIPTDLISDDIPFDSVQVEINIGQFSEADGWGTAAMPGATTQVLRVHSTAGGTVDAWGVVYVFNIRILIPLGTIYTLDATQAYTWYSPELGEIASIVSLAGEADPDFDMAASVRRRAFLDDDALLAITGAPLGGEPVVVNPGGSFSFDVTLQSQYDHAFFGHAWSSAILPNGNEMTVQVVPLGLPANADHTVTGLTQDIPPFAPAGNYTFKVNLGQYPGAAASDGFALTVEPGAAAAREGGEWPASGLERLSKPADNDLTFTGDTDTALPGRFTLAPVYPNPFNAATTVSLSLPETDDLTLRVVNTVGREVASLANGRFGAGEHRFSWDARSLPSGLYLVQAISASHGSAITKAMLVK